MRYVGQRLEEFLCLQEKCQQGLKNKLNTHKKNIFVVTPKVINTVPS
jgi:hypothetical protein